LSTHIKLLPKAPDFFLEKEASPSILSTGCFKMQIQA